MDKFKIGSKARLKYTRSAALHGGSRWVAGIEVMVIHIGRTEEEASEHDYVVSFDNGNNQAYVLSDQLEPLTEEPATWQEIQQLTNWNPTKEVAL